MDEEQQDENFVSLKTLKSNMKDALRKSGVLHAVKAQVRTEFINNLAPNGNLKAKSSIEDLSELEILFRSAVFYFLRRKEFNYTLSVYSAECGVDSNSMLSESAVIAKLNVNRTNKGANPLQDMSALDIVLQELNRRIGVVTCDSSTQSDYSGAGIRELLDARMNDIAKVYESKKEQDRLFPARGIEEKMLNFQRECEKRLREDFEIQLANVREVEIAKVRLEEAYKARQELESMRTELEANFERRMTMQTEREADSLRAAAERERQLQQAQYEARQRLQRELDDLRSRELSASKKLELDNQGLRLLESRLKEAQILLESREKELSRKEREADINMKNTAERAREEARERLREELEALMRERSGLKTERARLDADRESWDNVVKDASDWRQKCTSLETTLAQREEEIIALKHRISRLEFRQKVELTELAELTGMVSAEDMDNPNSQNTVLADPYSTASKAARTQHLLGLIQRNAELEARAKLSEQLEKEAKYSLERERDMRDRIERQLNEKQQELDRIIEFSKEFTVRVENERRRSQKEIEKLTRLFAVERGRVSVAVAQRNQIEQIVHEQRNAILQLQRSNKSIGHVKSISDATSAAADDDELVIAKGKSSVRSNNTKKQHDQSVQKDISAELEWLKKRREALEPSAIPVIPSSEYDNPPSGGSYLYGHEDLTKCIIPDVARNDKNKSVLDVDTNDRPQLLKLSEIELLQQEEARKARENRALEIQRMKDLLQRQQEENELDELRRTREALAEQQRLKLERDAVELKKREDIFKAKEDQQKKMSLLLAQQEEAIKKQLEEEKIEQESLNALNNAKFQTHQDVKSRIQQEPIDKRSDNRVISNLDHAPEEELKSDERFAEDNVSSIPEVAAEEPSNEAILEPDKEDELGEYAQNERLKQASRQDELEAKRIAELKLQQLKYAEVEETNRLRALLEVEEAEEVKRRKIAEDKRNFARDEADRIRREAEEEERRNQQRLREEQQLRIKHEEQEKENERKIKKEADEAAELAGIEENRRLKLEEEQRELELKEQADRREKERLNEQVEIEKQRLLDEEEAAQRERVEQERQAEIEAVKKREEDANALQAARAKVLARRKQKQERDSLESITSEASVRNSSSAPAFASSAKPEENMSIISEIEVPKNLEQSQSDDDIWF